MDKYQRVKFSKMDEALEGDSNGALKESWIREIERYTKALEFEVKKGLSPEEYKKKQLVLDATKIARAVILYAWNDYHAKLN